MEKCIHVSKIRPAWDHSILNPEKWLCFICQTTESVWACLSCSNVACGRFNEQHALKHYKENQHPISIEVNDKYVYCYVCDDYVLNDNAAGDLKLLRSALSAIATQKFTDIESRGRRLLRSYSHTGVIKGEHADEDDKMATAIWHQRQRMLGKVFGAWRNYILGLKVLKQKHTRKEPKKSDSVSSVLMKRTITPGVTGLRNLGNTCYMNSVLQVLSHIDAFRDFFLSLKKYSDNSPSISPQTSSTHISSSSTPSVSAAAAAKRVSPSSSKSPVKLSRQSSTSSSSSSSSPAGSKLLLRQTTVECFQHLMSTRSQTKKNSPQRNMGGLNGGSAPDSTRPKQHLICEVEAQGSTDKHVSLCSELHGLFRVLWSGKWAQVSPHAFLRSVWQAIPLFKGYAQHDAQEFLCELLDKVQRELDCVPKPLRREDAQLVTELFQGELVSQVTCLACGNVSKRNELFLDLSLEFPDRYQITKLNARVAQDICHVTEMLAKFTEIENLEGQIYACEKCNSKTGKHKEKIYTEAKKQLLINKLPQILRLHLKRFRWSGRNHREKINTHVAVDENLDLFPFCSAGSDQISHEYQLFAVVIHHGKGFGSGHYTAYTWNHEAESWVNCNDARMTLSNIEDVLMAQAYILFYRAVTDKLPLLTRFSSSDTSMTHSLCSTDTLPYLLKSESTLLLDHGDSEDGGIITPSKPNMSKQAMQGDSNLQTPVVSKLSSSKKTAQKGRKNEKASYKNSLDVSDSDLNDSSFVVIDSEISFKESPDISSWLHQGVKNKMDGKRKTPKRLKLSLDGLEPMQKKQKMSITPEKFYSKKRPSNHGRNSSGHKLHSTLQKLDKYLDTPAKVSPKSPSHLKRRKSTFW